MNDWDTIEKMINTLPQWDIIKYILGIQEELKCAKEDNLYQLRQNKNLQSKIDKAIEYIEKSMNNPQPFYEYLFGDENGKVENLDKLLNILKEDK